MERDGKGHTVLEARWNYLVSEVAKLKDRDATLGTTRGSCNLSKGAHGYVNCASFVRWLQLNDDFIIDIDFSVGDGMHALPQQEE